MRQRDLRQTSDANDGKIVETILALLRSRPPVATICPSEVARALTAEAWRPLMPAVRDAARSLARAGRIEVCQRGAVLDPDGEWRGPIRLRLTAGAQADAVGLRDRNRDRDPDQQDPSV